MLENRMTKEELENIVKGAINMAIQHAENPDSRREIDRIIGDFGGFWRNIMALGYRYIGPVETKDLQQRMIIYHHDKTENLRGNAAYAQALKFSLGGDLTREQYDKLIAKHVAEKD